MTVVLCACYLKVGDLGHFLCFIVNITIYGHGVSSALWSVFVVCISEKSVAVFVVAKEHNTFQLGDRLYCLYERGKRGSSIG